MAAGERRSIVIVACILCLFLGQISSQTEKSFPPSDRVKDWASALGRKLGRLLDVLTGSHALNGSYNDDSTLQGVEFRKVDPQKLVEDMADKLSKMLGKKMDALWLLVNAAEEITKNYTFNSQLKRDQVSYYNGKFIDSSLLDYDPHFNQDVNFNFSSVHIPVEIYDGDSSILNGLQWTGRLDEQFRKNYENDKQILWQFFGSQTGFMRTYPASKWNTHGQVDLFDVRRQSWYTQGSSSPKDMMILIDTSGSTHGQALQLMKNAIKSILDTLGENDFVNIAEFCSEAKFVSACFNHTAFVQANYRNKKQLEKDVDSLKAQGQADYQAGLRFAFQKFEEFSRNRTDGDGGVGANCNKVIILLTDGGTDNAEEVFQEYNWPNKSVRVFTYAVGPTATPVAAIRWMACANRGYFSQIPAMGAIRARVQDYVEVLGRPLALSYVEHSQWTSSHRTPLTDEHAEYTSYLKQGMEQLNVQPILWEITVEPREYIPVLSRPQVLKNAKAFEWGNVYKDHLGLGMMTTVTLPVYNRTLGSSNQTILGVMGIDVPTSDLGKRTPYLEIGPAGYSFAINPNGYAVFHPNLKRSGRYLKDPPNIDLVELELEKDDGQQVMQLRNQMIEGYKSQMVIDGALFLSPDKKYVSAQGATYAFTNITNTTFRLGLCVPAFQKWYPYFKTTSLPNISTEPFSEDGPAFLIAPWEYLGTLPLQNELDSTLASLVGVINSGNLQASELTPEQLQLLHHLAMDMKIWNEMKKYVAALKSKDDSSNSSFANSTTEDMDEDESLFGFSFSSLKLYFMATNGGLTVVHPPSQVGEFDNDLDITNSSYYKRAMYSADYIFTIDNSRYNKSYPSAMAFRSVSVARHNHRIAVTGVKLEVDGLRDFAMKVLKNETVEDNSAHFWLTCDDVDEVVCYLVDDGGFLVSSNQENDTYFTPGQFLGKGDPQVWHLLYGSELFGRSVEYDFQATCQVKENTTSAGHRSIKVPNLGMFFEVLTMSWWTSKFMWLYTSFNIYNWLFDSKTAYGEETYGAEGDLEEEDCVLAIQQFYLRPEKARFSGNISCGADFRDVLAHPVLGTNLLLILARKPCISYSDFDTTVLQEPYKISAEEEKNLICTLARQPRKRVPSYGCYDSDPKEDNSKCGAASLPANRMQAMTAVCVSITIIWMLIGGDDR